jgi:lysophospholipase L1-like esterase
MAALAPALVCASAIVAIGAGWSANQTLVFHGGVIALLLGLLAGALQASRNPRRAWLAPPCLAAASILVAFGAVELAAAARIALFPRTPPSRLPTYEEALADRDDFLRWWDRHLQRWARLGPPLYIPDPAGRNPHVLAPGVTTKRGESSIRINRLGFRGPEISREKNDRFRVIALGESTTFGLTSLASDRTWPAVLEERIATELECDRPVEIVNAGVAGWTLANQLARMDDDIFSLQPDLLITYHGYNGYRHFMRNVPGLVMLEPTVIEPRPSRVLESVERALRMGSLRRAQPDPVEAGILLSRTRVRDAPYRKFYENLVRRSRRHNVDVALGSFNLAVDASSPERAFDFYEERYPDVKSSVIANVLHNRIVRRMPGATFVDTSAKLDGAYREAYVDLVHFTQLGRDRLAENFFEGLLATLRSHPRLRCRERSGH